MAAAEPVEVVVAVNGFAADLEVDDDRLVDLVSPWLGVASSSEEASSEPSSEPEIGILYGSTVWLAPGAGGGADIITGCLW